MATYRLTDPQLYSLSDSLSGIIQYDINLTANAVTQYELSFSFLKLIFLSVLSQDDDLIRKACLEKKKSSELFQLCQHLSLWQLKQWLHAKILGKWLEKLL